MTKYTLYTVIFLISIFSCKNNKSLLQEEPINLYPNKEIIKKQYHKYSLLDPFNPNLILYTPIEPSLNDPRKAKTLIKATDPYDLQYLNKYIRDEMNGEYIDYVFQNDTILYRYYSKHYKINETKEFDSKKKIEDYLLKHSIDFKFIKYNEDKNLIYLLKKKEQPFQSFCVIDSHDNILEIYIIYNSKDTIMSLSQKSLRPFRGSKIED